MPDSALLVIDMQQFFFVENSAVDEKRLATNCAKIINASRQAGVPVVHVETIYRKDGGDWPRAFRADPGSWCSNLVAGNPLSGVVEPINVEAQEFLVQKKRFSAFYNTNLDDLLRGMACSRVFLIGYSADVCIRFTAVDAYNRGYAVALVEDGLEAFREPLSNSLTYLQWLIDAQVINFDTYNRLVTDGALR